MNTINISTGFIPKVTVVILFVIAGFSVVSQDQPAGKDNLNIVQLKKKSDSLPGSRLPNVADSFPQAQSLQEVVISASRISEKQLTAPVSVSKMSNVRLLKSSAPSFFDAVGNMRAVQMIVPSMGFKVLNTRGFSNTTNVRFVQLIDNVDNQSPHIGAPIANALSPGDLDIDNVEVIQGSASALYGMNAINGMVNFTTKNPFSSPGLSIQQQVGLNHVNDPSISARWFNETSLRWAKVINEKWAFKINAGFIKGYDWIADNRTDLNPNANASTNLTGADNPAYDPVNGYGNESSNRRTLSLQGKNYVVARTGYYEKEVVDYRLQNMKGDIAIFFRPKPGTEFSYTYRTAFLNNVYQRSNRFRLEDYLLQQHILQYKNKAVQSLAYFNMENTGNSYNLRSMAENIDLSFKTNNQWFTNYSSAFNTAISGNDDVAGAHRQARASADNGRLMPGTSEFDQKLKQLQQINNWDKGAALKVKAGMLHFESTVDIAKLLKTSYQILAGGYLRNYIIVPDGNYFINPTDSGHNLNYYSYGLFLQASKKYLHDKLQIGITLRANGNKYFNVKFNPRVTAVYELRPDRVIRFSFQKGYRFPSIFEGYSNINSGGVKRVGGLKVMSNGIFERSWLKSSIDSFQATVNRDVNTSGITQSAAINKNKDLLKTNSYTYLEPEEVNSFELGYRGIFFKNRLFLDAGIYYNRYSNFIAQIEASIPNTSDSALMPAYLFDRNKQSRYRLWTNSKTAVHNYGAELELRYVINRHYSFTVNGCYQELKNTAQNDGLEDGFNTPRWMANAGISAAEILQKFGFSINAKVQSRYYWESFLVNGYVPAVFNIDAMVRYVFSKPSLEIKMGASNLLNHYYYSILGGPSIGGFYYTSLTWNLK